jgi:hypothetical protein
LHLYLKQIRKTWFEMHISSVVHIWSKKTKNILMYSFFSTKTFADILLITNWIIILKFQLFLLFCLKMHALFLRNRPPVHFGKILDCHFTGCDACHVIIFLKSWFHDGEILREKLHLRNADDCTWAILLNFPFFPLLQLQSWKKISGI